MTERNKRTTRTRPTRGTSRKRTREVEAGDISRKPRSKKTRASKAVEESTASTQLVSRNLAAEFRPRKLDDFVGQEHVTKVVKGWLKARQFPASIMVMGETGAGKTTFAKLIARYVNCETLNACGKCGYCKYKDELPDVIHINCGEKGKIEDIRELISGSKMAPRYRKRIYILDEVHMASAQAREALLVPVETPPPGTIWILCTTEEDKIKSTLSNRCQTLIMKPVEPEIIADRLGDIVDSLDLDIQESRKQVDEVLDTIADFSNGQVRKAISDLDVFLSAYASGDVSFDTKDFVEVYEKQAGADMDKLAVLILAAILKEDIPNFVKVCTRVGKDTKAVISKFIWLTNWLIQYDSGAVQFVPYIGKQWFEAKKKNSVGKYSLPLLLHIAHVANEIDRNILQTPGLNANAFMMTKFGDMLASNYFDNFRK